MSFHAICGFVRGEVLLATVGDVAVDLEISAIHGTRHEARVRPRTRQGELAFRGVVARHLQPDMRIDAGTHADVWKLYAASGYFNLSGKEPTSFDDLEIDAYGVSRRLADCEDVGFRVVSTQGKEVLASVSMIRPYSATWLGHQMAKHTKRPFGGERSKAVLRELYQRAFASLAVGPEFAWMLGYCEASVPWMRAAHIEFAARYEKDGRACLVPFQLLELDTARPLLSSKERMPVDEATPRGARALLFELAQKRPRAYLEALDLVEGRFGLTDVTAAWGDGDLVRTRTMLIARNRGLPVAAAVVETAQRGTNLFNLLDGVRLFRFETSAAASEIELAFASLLSASADHYRARGRDAFVYFCEQETDPQAVGARDLGAGFTWIVSATLRDAFLEHVHGLTLARPSRPAVPHARATSTHAPSWRSK